MALVPSYVSINIELCKGLIIDCIKTLLMFKAILTRKKIPQSEG